MYVHYVVLKECVFAQPDLYHYTVNSVDGNERRSSAKLLMDPATPERIGKLTTCVKKWLVSVGLLINKSTERIAPTVYTFTRKHRRSCETMKCFFNYQKEAHAAPFRTRQEDFISCKHEGRQQGGAATFAWSCWGSQLATSPVNTQ